MFLARSFMNWKELTVAASRSAFPLHGRRALGLAVLGLSASGLSAPGLSASAIRVMPRMRLGGTGVALGALERLRPMLRSELGVELEITRGLGSQGGKSAVAAGRLDLSVSARAPSATERGQPLAHHLWASTPLVFGTHADSAVDNLTSQQAVGMIGGDITRWEDGHRVRITRRPSQDSDTALLAGLSEAMDRAVAAMQCRPGVLTAVTDHDQAMALERSLGSFGVIGLGLIRSENRAIKPLMLDGRAPTDAAWPMHKSLVLVYRAQPDAAVSELRQLLCCQSAAALLLPSGFRVRGSA